MNSDQSSSSTPESRAYRCRDFQLFSKAFFLRRDIRDGNKKVGVSHMVEIPRALDGAAKEVHQGDSACAASVARANVSARSLGRFGLVGFWGRIACSMTSKR